MRTYPNNHRFSALSLLKLACLAIAMVCFSACSDDDNNGTGLPRVSFAQFEYTLSNKADQQATLTIKTSKPFAAAKTIPFTLYGAEEGTDFTLSADAFTFQPGDSTASITVTRKTIDDEKTLTVTLDKTDGVTLGAVNYAPVYFLGANVYSFNRSYYTMSMVTDVEMTIYDLNGRTTSLSNTDTTRVKVEAAEGSTAEEGIDFEFADGPYVRFAPEKTQGTIKLNFKQLRQGHDRIVLKASDGQSLIGGNNGFTTIKINGPSDITGTWRFSSVANADWWTSSWGADVSVLVDGTPDGDSFTLTPDGDNYLFTPSFAGKLKNYFTAAGKAVKEGSQTKYLYEQATGMRPPTAEMTVLRIDNINLNFSPTDRKIGSYRVSFHMAVNSDTGNEELLMTIDEYEPTSKEMGSGYMDWATLYSYMVYSADDPVMLSAPIRIAFTRAE